MKVPTPCNSGIELKIMDFNTRCVIVKCGQIIINTTISRKEGSCGRFLPASDENHMKNGTPKKQQEMN